jgi:hypothetical protein
MDELHAFFCFLISVSIRELMVMKIKMTLAGCHGRAGRYAVIAWLQWGRNPQRHETLTNLFIHGLMV